MPRVPVYDRQQVGQAAMPTPMQRPAPVGAPAAVMSSVATQLGGLAADIAEHERRQAEAVQITDFKTGLEDDWTELYHDDEKGFSRLRGQEAFGKERDLLAEMEKRGRDRLSQIASPRAREIATQELRGYLSGRRRQVENFIGQQREIANRWAPAFERAPAAVPRAFGPVGALYRIPAAARCRSRERK